MFGLKGRDTFNKPKSSVGYTFDNLGKWWLKATPYFLGILIIVTIGILAHVGFKYLNNIDVTEKERQEYIVQKNTEKTFKKKKFDIVKANVIGRAEKYANEKKYHKDIFYSITKLNVPKDE